MNHPPNNNNVIDNNADNDAMSPAIAEVVVVGANDVAVVADADAAAANEDQGVADVDVATLDILPPAEREQIYQEAMTLLQNRFNLPSRLRDRTMVRFAQQFIANVKEDIHKTITDTRMVDEGYDGLDSEKDTEEEVETAIRCCPENLTRRDERFGCYPIKCLTLMESDDNTKDASNVNAASFVHLFVRLAIEFTSFEEHERGGLLITDDEGYNVLHTLVATSGPSYDENHHKCVDTSFLAVLVRLRHARLFTKDDIQQYELVLRLCKLKVFANQRFRFLTEIDPVSLLQTDENGCLPWHWATYTILQFRPVCDAVFRFYPKWKGIQLLHQKDTTYQNTPFQCASQCFGHTAVLTILEETLARYSDTILPDIPKALILAATEERIHVECVYFLLKRQPDVVLNMLSRYRQGLGIASSSADNNTNSPNNENTHTSSRILRRTTRKRKRN